MDRDEMYAKLQAIEARRVAAEKYYADMAAGLEDFEFAGLLHAVMKERNVRLARIEELHPGLGQMTDHILRKEKRGDLLNNDF